MCIKLLHLSEVTRKLSCLVIWFWGFFFTSLSDNFSLSVVISNYNINPLCISYSCGCCFKLNQKRTINMFSFCETNACLGVTLCKNQLLDRFDYYIMIVLHLWLSANCFVMLLFILQLENNFFFLLFLQNNIPNKVDIKVSRERILEDSYRAIMSLKRTDVLKAR